MNRRRSIMLLAIAVLAVGTTSFFTGRLMAYRRQSISAAGGWLQNAPAQVRQAEQEFEREARRLAQAVTSQKSALAALLADPDSTNTEILSQVDEVIASNTVLMTAVGEHLVKLHDSLSPQERQRLMKSCFDSLQGRMQRRYRWRGGAQDDAAWQGRGNGYRGGRGSGGFGPGRGRQYRGGRGSSAGAGPADKLQLTAAQIAFAEEHDPNFSDDGAHLREDLAAACAGLLAGFEDVQLSDERLLARLGKLIEAHNALERRVARYVVMIRPQLSPQQRQSLAGLSRGGYGYRGGRSTSSDAGPIGLLDAGSLFRKVLGDAV